jgi:hypothetical protein
MSDEPFEQREEYKKESETLLFHLQEREEMTRLLKIAHPSKVSEIREVIAGLDHLIERTEKIMQIILEKYQLEQEAEEHYLKVQAKMDKALPELLAYLAEHNPEAGEKLVADLAEIEARNRDED